MANNYPFDPNNVASVSHSAISQDNQRGSLPETPYISTPHASGIEQVATASSAPLAERMAGFGNWTPPHRLMAGTILSGGRYKIETLVASGGMGAVYRAIDTRFNRPCAVKEMLNEFSSETDRAQAVEWFSREATLLLDLNHPCIPRVRDFFAESGQYYLVMDFIDGRTLAEVLEREGHIAGLNGTRGISEERSRSWMRQLCGVLNYLHGQSPPVIFRDLKPSNIMVTNRSEIKLIDFGIARTFQSQHQATVIMTLGYAPPEQLHGMPEPRSDIYALGATMYRLLTRHDVANNKPSIFSFPPLRLLRPDITLAFEQIITKALMPNLEQRWACTEEMEHAILNLPPLPPAETIPSRPVPSSTPSSPSLPSQTPNVAQPSPRPSGTPQVASHTTTGPAGSYINAALNHLSALPARIEDAYNAVQAAHTMEPNNSIVHKIFGQVFARRQPPNVDNAIRAYLRSVELYCNDAETHKLLGDVWLYLRPNYIQAISAYTQALRLNTTDFETYERLALCLEKTGQLEAALREYQEALRLAARPSQVPLVLLRLHFAIGQIARRLGLSQLPVAENAFIQVLILNPSDHRTRYLLAQVYDQEGKLDEAFRECGYVLGPLGNSDPTVSQMYNSLRIRLGR